MRIANHVVDLVGGTPLVKLSSVVPAGSALVAAKIEYLNPGGSSKDRIAVKMVDEAEASGALKPGGVIVEPTSGNTGVGLALVAQQRGYSCIFVCPDKVSEDKRNTLRAYGAEVVVCPTAVPPEHPDSYYNVSDRLVRETPNAWKPDQYSNPAGPASHYETTGPEIWADADGTVTHFVAGVGTGGTITGTGRYLKEVSGGRVKIIGADPEGSVYSGGTGRPYLVEGVGEDFWPSAYDPEIDDWMSSYGFLREPLDGHTDRPSVGAVLRRKSGDLPALVHTHPSETIRDAIEILREYNVSQMPVVGAEPPVVIGEVAGSVSERTLISAVFEGRASLTDPVSKHMEPPLPLLGAHEDLDTALATLKDSDAVMVIEDGKPLGVLTRHDLLGVHV